MFGFEKAYEAWLEHHKTNASGERLRRLAKKHGYGEKLLLQQAWWPVVGNFDRLYPEYEFVDGEGKYYYFDFAYVADPRPTALESDGFGAHARDLDRDLFTWGLDRQNEMVLAEWNVLRFSHDKLKADPLACQHKIRRLFSVYYVADDLQLSMNLYQRELIRHLRRTGVSFTMAEACSILDKGETFTRSQLRPLVDLGIIESAIGSARERIHYYRLKPTHLTSGIRSL